jgi:hypothetical protein
MNIQLLGETSQEKMARIMARSQGVLDKVLPINTVILDVVKDAPPGATVEEVTAAVKERLHPTKAKPPYLTYAALAVGAYLIFK